MTRKQAREETFILIFEKVFNDESADELLELAKETRDIKPDEYMESVFRGVCTCLEELDALISANTKGWRIERISKTALCILRLCLYEMKYRDDIPVSVSINEAVELAKKYASAEDASFVNGLLSSVAKAL